MHEVAESSSSTLSVKTENHEKSTFDRRTMNLIHWDSNKTKTHPSSYCLQQASLKSVTGDKSQVRGRPLNHRWFKAFIAFSASSSRRNYAKETIKHAYVEFSYKYASLACTSYSGWKIPCLLVFKNKKNRTWNHMMIIQYCLHISCLHRLETVATLYLCVQKSSATLLDFCTLSFPNCLDNTSNTLHGSH